MSEIGQIAVLGAGPGGIAAAAALSRRGYSVSLYSRNGERIAPLQARGGVEIEGSLGEEFVPICTISSNLEEVIPNAALILVSTPAYGQVPTVTAALRWLKPGQAILLLSGSAGSLEVAQVLQGAGHSLDEILLGETVTLPQSARIVGEARIRIRLPSRIRAAAFPARNTGRLVDVVGDALMLLPKPNVLDPGLNNPNFLIHPGPMVLNYAAVERADGYLSLMNEGMTRGVLRLMDAVDQEKMALQRTLGLEELPIDNLYYETGNTPDVYRVSGEPFGLRDRIWGRYITEDVPYGSVLYSSLGRLLGVPTPVNDGINSILSAADGVDYWATGRTVARMGIAGLSKAQLIDYLETGRRPADSGAKNG